MQCHCGSGLDFEQCCAPLLRGEKQASTAEELMRSRYSAFVADEIEYLGKTLHPEHRHDHDVAATRRWAKNSQWLGLQVLSVEGGGSADEEGRVEFVATYKENGLIRPHREIGRFCRVDGIWYFVDGELVQPGTQVGQGQKVGRNDPCPCGSGKKYKKCCGR